MRISQFVLLILLFIPQIGLAQSERSVAKRILNDTLMGEVDMMARELARKGFYAGAGYQMVWSRDLNTFVELACEEYSHDALRSHVLLFFHFQQENGEMLDGYVEAEGFTWDDPNPYYSDTAPGYVGFKNTVETDQETSLIQLLAKYVECTGDESILKEKVAGRTVYERLKYSLEFLMEERFAESYGLIKGATTFDWGDVQVEGGAVVDIDEFTHWSVDVYDNAMLILALESMTSMSENQDDIETWKDAISRYRNKIRKYLWDEARMKFIPHRYTDGSPFPETFDENEIHYHGGTAVAIEAGILSNDEIKAVALKMEENRLKAKAQSIGLTLFPTYPSHVLGENISPPFEYQNGGDWTWFGGRMIQQLIVNGYVEEAYDMVQPMLKRVVINQGFFEWYSREGFPRGSSDFKGSAGVLWKSIQLFEHWADSIK